MNFVFSLFTQWIICSMLGLLCTKYALPSSEDASETVARIVDYP